MSDEAAQHECEFPRDVYCSERGFISYKEFCGESHADHLNYLREKNIHPDLLAAINLELSLRPKNDPSNFGKFYRGN